MMRLRNLVAWSWESYVVEESLLVESGRSDHDETDGRRERPKAKRLAEYSPTMMSGLMNKKKEAVCKVSC